MKKTLWFTLRDNDTGNKFCTKGIYDIDTKQFRHIVKIEEFTVVKEHKTTDSMLWLKENNVGFPQEIADFAKRWKSKLV